MRGRLLRVLVGLLIVVVIVLLVAWAMIERIARTGIEEGATYALGVKTTVDDVGVSLFSGEVTIDGLKIDNPEGYSTPHLMKSGHWELAVRPGSLLTDTVEMPKFELEGMDLNIEQKAGKSNVSVVMDNMKKLSKQKKEAGGRKVKIDTVLIKDVVAHVQVLPGSKPVTITVASIELKDVTPENSKGLVIGELFQRLLPAVIAGVVENARGVPGIPADFLNSLSGDIAGVAETLGENASKLIKQGGTAIGRVIKDIPQPVKELPKNVGDKLKDILPK